ncbi:MAG: hypothetical protein NVS3B1_22100 [Marmoricola sp.]
MESQSLPPEPEPQATSATDPAPVAPGGVPLGEEGVSPLTEAAPAEQPPVEDAAAAPAPEPEPESAAQPMDTSDSATGDPENYDAEVVPGDAGTPAGFDATQPAPAVMPSEDGPRQHGEITPGLGVAPEGDLTDLPEERPSTAGVSEPEQIETQRPDIGTPGA